MSNPLVNPFMRLRDPSDKCLDVWVRVRNMHTPARIDIDYLKDNCPYEFYKYETLHSYREF